MIICNKDKIKMQLRRLYITIKIINTTQLNDIELQQEKQYINYCFKVLDKNKVPFKIQNDVIAAAYDRFNYKSYNNDVLKPLFKKYDLV